MGRETLGQRIKKYSVPCAGLRCKKPIVHVEKWPQTRPQATNIPIDPRPAVYLVMQDKDHPEKLRGILCTDLMAMLVSITIKVTDPDDDTKLIEKVVPAERLLGFGTSHFSVCPDVDAITRRGRDSVE